MTSVALDGRDPLASSVSTLLEDGPKTLEAIHLHLARTEPRLVAAGRQALGRALDRIVTVERTSGLYRWVEVEDDEIVVPEVASEEDWTSGVHAATRFVVFDLETNADTADAARHEIVEIAALRVVGGAESDHFHSLARPTRALADVTKTVTGLTDADLADAPPLADVLTSFLEWLGDDPVIAHNGIGYDFVVLDSACAAQGIPLASGQRLDTLDLAHLVHPRAGQGIIPDVYDRPAPASRRLEDLALHHNLALPDVRHRASDDTKLLHEVTVALLDSINGSEPSAQLARFLLHRANHPWASFLDPVDRAPSLVTVLPSHAGQETESGTGTFDPHAAVAPLREGGALVSAGRSVRPSQVQMAESVALAFAEKRRQLVEAPTGTGKTFAYLVPAVEWARASGVPVAIATHSKVLQSQVLAEAHVLGRLIGPFSTVLLKGVENYVSVEQLSDELSAPPADPDAGFALAVIARWAAITPTGDWDDLRVWALASRGDDFDRWRWRLSLEDRLGPWEELADYCVYERAMAGAETAQIVVLNHAVAVSRESWYDEDTCLVVDEAHNLEDSATAALTESAGEAETRRLLRYIYDPARRWGTLGRWMDATGTPAGHESVQAVLDMRRQVLKAVSALGEAVVEHVRQRSGARMADMERYGTSYRFRSWESQTPEFIPVRQAAIAVSQTLRSLADLLGDLPVPDKLRGRYKCRAIESELARIGRQARKLGGLTYEVVHATEEDMWIHIADLRRTDEGFRWKLRKVPLTVGGQLQGLWDELRSVVLTSATLQVQSSFAHVIERLGVAGAAPPLALPTPFDQIPESELVVIPDHLPTPTGSRLTEFAQVQAEEVGRTILLTGGRTLALYTARSRMELAYKHLGGFLDQHALPLLCQGTQPGPALVERMRTDVRSSLLATRSFWEGVDIPGEALTTLLIEKLPFASIGDPVNEARMDALQAQGRDPFADYLVPQAVIRFAQGVGRLIRTQEDRGAVVVMDKRLRRPVSYRHAFLSSLPGPPKFLTPTSAEEGYAAIADHLGLPWDDTVKALLGEVPSTDEWAFLSELQIADEDATNDELVNERLEIVRERLRFDDWRTGQLDVMRALIAGRDVLGVLPTGAGKSLTYQLPALLRPGLTLVISPLIALMRDQVRGLRSRGVRSVAALHSGQSQAESDDIVAAARSGSLKLLYLAPERLWNPKFTSALRGAPIARVAVDEAHCVSQWGHTFRPEYAAIPAAIDRLAEGLGRRPAIAALTATATPQVQDEIRAMLRLGDKDTVTRSPDRPELLYCVEEARNYGDRDVVVLRVAESLRDKPIIVYVPRQKDTVRLAGLLRTANHRAAAYHGGMTPEERVHVEESFVYDEVSVVVATKAFGLGIDKPDVEAVVHLEMPASVEEYIQETGRGARGALDGSGPSRAWCVLIRAPRDCGIHGMFVKGAAPGLDVLRATWDRIQSSDGYLLPDDMVDDPEEWGAKEAVTLSISYLQQTGCVERGDDIAWAGRVFVPADARARLDHVGPESVKEHGLAILKAAEALGTEEYSPHQWARQSGLTVDDQDDALWELHRHGVVGFAAFQYAMRLTVTGKSPSWTELHTQLRQRRASVQRLSDEAKAYRKVDGQCRRSWLRWYMGDEEADGHCEGCDVCLPNLVRPWDGVTMNVEALNDAVPATFTILAAVKDLQQHSYGRVAVAMMLAGKSATYRPHLDRHPLFGALSGLRREKLDAAIEDCLKRGLLTEQEITNSEASNTWTAVFLTDEGRRMI